MAKREFLVGKRNYPALIIHAQERRAFEYKYLTPESKIADSAPGRLPRNKLIN